MRILFRIIIGFSALFIAGCSAFFSVRGLGLLFAGSAVAVMVMAASLEVGKLIAASFLYQYWSRITILLRLYLMAAVLVLIGITSLGIYGYLASAYEKTTTQVTLLEQQIESIQREIADAQTRIDGSKTQVGKTTDNGRQDLGALSAQITQADQLLTQSLARLEDRRKVAKDKRDRDIEQQSPRIAEAAALLKTAQAAEVSAIAGLNDRLVALDRAVDAYTREGGAGFLKEDSIKKGQLVRSQQSGERAQIAAELTQHRQTQEQLRADYARSVASVDQQLAAVRSQYTQETAAFDVEERKLRQARMDTVALIEQQMGAVQTSSKTVAAAGDNQIEALYSRIRSGNTEIRRIQEQIAATDIGSYRFVARAFNAPVDQVVKWLMVIFVFVFDPLAVALTIGFNIAMSDGKKRRPGLLGGVSDTDESAEPADAAPRTRRWAALVTTSIILLAVSLAGGAAYHYREMILPEAAAAAPAHAELIPDGSFAVVALRPPMLQAGAADPKKAGALSPLISAPVAAALGEMLRSGFDSNSDVYAFVKYPTASADAAPSSGDRPVMICGLIARVTDPVAAEAGLSRIADTISRSLRTSATTTAGIARNRSMVRFGKGRYLDPEGSFFTFGLTDHEAVLLMEIEGDPAHPRVEAEMRTCLALPEDSSVFQSRAASRPRRPLPTGGAIALWFDAARCFADMPKTAAAQARYAQLQRHLDFDLALTINPTTSGEMGVTAEYTYNGERFKAAGDPTVIELLAKLGPADAAGIPGRLMDRCADTLDFDSLIEHLRQGLTDAQTGGRASQVLVEKSITSTRDGRFNLTAHFDPASGPPLVSAFRSLVVN